MSDRAPNIILCTSDQLRPFELACYGHPTVRTPNIDRLAAEGVRFEVACSNSPLCIPARSVMLSGQYARTCTGTSSNFCGFPPCDQRLVCRDTTLPEVLRDAGYATGLVGKWHLHPKPSLLGFDEATYPHNLHLHTGQAFYDIEGRRTVVDGFSMDYESDRVRDFVSEHAHEPFFLWYSLSPPHMPLMDAPERYTRMYSRDEVVLRDNVFVDGKMTHDPAWFHTYMWDFYGGVRLHLEDPETYMPDDQTVRHRMQPYRPLKFILRELRALWNHPDAGPAVRARFPYLDIEQADAMDLRDVYALYYGMVTAVDDKVGELLDLVDEAGIAEDTIIVFTADHGDCLGSHGMWMKDRLYDEACRIPMIYRRPGRLEPNVVASAVTSLVDIMPTTLSLAGCAVPPTCQGTDLAPVIEREAPAAGENVAYIECHQHRAIGVRSATHLYGVPMEGACEAEWQPVGDPARHLFFDLRDDPFEQRNLAAGGAQNEAAEALRRGLTAWHNRTPRRPVPEPTRGLTHINIY